MTFLKVTQARPRLGGVSSRQVRRYIIDGYHGVKLEALRFGRDWRIPEHAIAAFMDAVDRASRPEPVSVVNEEHEAAMRKLEKLGLVKREGGSND